MTALVIFILIVGYVAPAVIVIPLAVECSGDGYLIVARILFWPLFALKLFLRVLMAGCKDLLSW